MDDMYDGALKPDGVIMTKILSLAALEGVKMTPSSPANDQNFMNEIISVSCAD